MIAISGKSLMLIMLGSLIYMLDTQVFPNTGILHVIALHPQMHELDVCMLPLRRTAVQHACYAACLLQKQHSKRTLVSFGATVEKAIEAALPGVPSLWLQCPILSVGRK